MSTFSNDGTFTSSNGPAAAGGSSAPGGVTYPSTKTLLEYIETYQEVLTQLSEKADTDWTGSRTDLSAAAQALLNNSTATLAAYVNKFAEQISSNTSGIALKADADEVTELASKITELTAQLKLKADTTALSSYAKTTDLSSYAKTSSVSSLSDSLESLAESLSTLEGAVEEINEDIARTDTEIKTGKPLYADGVHSDLFPDRLTDFTGLEVFSARYAGTGAQTDTATYGMYVVGMLSDDWQDSATYTSKTTTEKAAFSKYMPKAGQMFLKYINSHCMDAVISVTAASSGDTYTGRISATVTHEWPDIKFHAIYGTGTDGAKHIYIGLSSTVFAADSDNYPSTSFYGAGINVYPAGHDKFVVPNGIVTSLDDIDATEAGLVGKVNPDNLITEDDIDAMWEGTYETA